MSYCSVSLVTFYRHRVPVAEIAFSSERQSLESLQSLFKLKSIVLCLLAVSSCSDFFCEQMNEFDRPDIVTHVISEYVAFMIIWDKVIF